MSGKVMSKWEKQTPKNLNFLLKEKKWFANVGRCGLIRSILGQQNLKVCS